MFLLKIEPHANSAVNRKQNQVKVSIVATLKLARECFIQNHKYFKEMLPTIA